MQQLERSSSGGRNSACSLRRGTAIVALLALCACASTPEPPNQAIQAAELAIASAERARIADTSSPELGEARRKLMEARTAINEKDMTHAERLAEESRVHADLAIAQADLSKARTVNDEMKQGTETLKDEMQRNQGVQQ